MPKNVKVQFSCRKLLSKICLKMYFMSFPLHFFGELVAHTGDQVIYFNTYLGLHLGDSKLILESLHRYIMCLSIFVGFSCE